MKLSMKLSCRLLSIHKALFSDAQHSIKPGMVVHTCNHLGGRGEDPKFKVIFVIRVSLLPTTFQYYFT